MDERTKWLTPDEAAAFLGIAKSCLYAWRAEKMGPRHYKLQRQLRYRQEDLEDFLRRCESPGGMGGREATN